MHENDNEERMNHSRKTQKLRRAGKQGATALLLLASASAAAVEVDGYIGAEEWREARYISDFRKTQPLTREPGSLKTEAWVMATPEGLAVAFRNEHPRSVPRTNQRVQRDFNEQVDRVNLMVDYDGDHRTGYNFTVASTGAIYDAIITNEANFNADWDSGGQYAVPEDASSR